MNKFFRLLVNGRQRSRTSMPSLRPARRNAATTTVSCSVFVPPGMKLLSNLMLSRGRTRTLLMRSRIFSTSWVMEAGPSMSLTSRGAGWRLRRKNSRQLLRKLRLLLSRKKTRYKASF